MTFFDFDFDFDLNDFYVCVGNKRRRNEELLIKRRKAIFDPQCKKLDIYVVLFNHVIWARRLRLTVYTIYIRLFDEELIN